MNDPNDRGRGPFTAVGATGGSPFGAVVVISRQVVYDLRKFGRATPPITAHNRRSPVSRSDQYQSTVIHIPK